MLQQGDPGWLPERVGKLTASRMKDVLDVTKKGLPGADRINYLKDLVAERMEGSATGHFVTAAMQYGLDWEAPAAEEYEAITGNIVMPGGWFPHPHIENFGATPDRLVGDEGLVEIKVPTSRTYVEWRTAGVVPEVHKPQMIVQLLCTRRAWCDFVAFNPRAQDPRWRIFIRRFTPTAEEYASVESEAVKFLKEVDDLFDLVTTTEIFA